MKRNNSTFIGWQGAILAIVVVVAGLLDPAYCRTDDPVLVLQQTPPEGGTITPHVGVHHFGLNTDVTLRAVAKPGYQFIYWLGDVSDPTANRTIVYLDAPKIVIAVFERVEYELLAVEQRAQSAPIGGLYASAGDYYGQGGFGGPGGKRPHKFRRPSLPEPEPNDFPVPIPEPATAVLLVLGSLFAFVKRGPKRINK